MEIDNKNDDLLQGTIELTWPGKNYPLKNVNGKWNFSRDCLQKECFALLHDSQVGEGSENIGYAVKADVLSALESLYPFAASSVQLIYFDAPRLNVFQDHARQGYASSTWLSLVQQTAQKSIRCLSKNGFFALHTDEEMAHYARIILNDVFGTNHYVGTFAWQKQYGPQNDHVVPTDVLDYITVFSKNSIEDIEKIGLLVTPKDLKDDGDFRGCFIDGHKGARSGSEATKFKVNTSPYHWEIIESNLPNGRFYFDKILGTLWFDSVDTCGDFYVTVQASDKSGSTATKKLSFSIRDPQNVHDVYELPSRIWWLLKDDNDIKKGGKLSISDLAENQSIGIRGMEFSLVFKAQGGEPFTMANDSPGTGRFWEFGKRTLIEGVARAKVSFGSKGTALPSIKKYFDRADAKKIQAVMNFLPWYDFGDTQDATQHCKTLKKLGLIQGQVNMMAKPQKLLGHLITLLAPNKKDLVLSIGESNGVFAAVANKLNRRFIHIVGNSEEDIKTWNQVTLPRILATLNGQDSSEIEGNDSLQGAQVNKGVLDVLTLSKSSLLVNKQNHEITPNFDDNESIEDFYASLSGAYRSSANTAVYKRFDDKVVVVIPCDEILDAMTLDRLSREFAGNQLTVIYEASEGLLNTSEKVITKRAPFELIQNYGY